MFDIEAHHRRENVIHALTGSIRIGATGAVARGDVQIASAESTDPTGKRLSNALMTAKIVKMTSIAAS